MKTTKTSIYLKNCKFKKSGDGKVLPKSFIATIFVNRWMLELISAVLYDVDRGVVIRNASTRTNKTFNYR